MQKNLIKMILQALLLFETAVLLCLTHGIMYKKMFLLFFFSAKTEIKSFVQNGGPFALSRAEF